MRPHAADHHGHARKDREVAPVFPLPGAGVPGRRRFPPSRYDLACSCRLPPHRFCRFYATYNLPRLGKNGACWICVPWTPVAAEPVCHSQPQPSGAGGIRARNLTPPRLPSPVCRAFKEPMRWPVPVTAPDSVQDACPACIPLPYWLGASRISRSHRPVMLSRRQGTAGRDESDSAKKANMINEIGRLFGINGYLPHGYVLKMNCAWRRTPSRIPCTWNACFRRP